MLRSSMPGVREARVCRRSIENVVRSRSGAVAHDWLENKRTHCSLRSPLSARSLAAAPSAELLQVHTSC